MLLYRVVWAFYLEIRKWVNNMKRTLAALRRRIREELRAEGPDGAGYSSFIIGEHINSAIQVLSSMYPIRDEVSFRTSDEVWENGSTYEEEDVVYHPLKWYYCTDDHTAAEDNEPGKGDDWEDYWREAVGEETNYFDLDEVIDTRLLENIVRVVYADREIMYVGPNEFNLARVQIGEVRSWYLWGSLLILFGEVEPDVELDLWITRMPKPLRGQDDEMELPPHTDEAVVQYAIAGCYRESRDYERAAQHYRNFLHHEERLQSRSIPQGQRARQPMMQSIYWPAMSGRRGKFRTADTYPDDGRPPWRR